MYISSAGVPTASLTGAAKDFADKFTAQVLGTEEMQPYTIYALQAAQVLLDAIAHSDGTRKDVIAKVFATSVTNGVLGTFTISATGDPLNASGAVTAFTFYLGADHLVVANVLTPKQATVDAALGH
jgi:hypothetical protein